jgi:hypothetical protein
MDQVFRKIAIRPPTLPPDEMIEWQAMSVHGPKLRSERMSAFPLL